MRKGILITALLVVCGAARAFDAAPLLPWVTAQTADPYLVAWYKLDGNATDSSGNGYNGTVAGATVTNGVYGQAYYFNGTSDYIEVAHNAALVGWTDFAMALWVKSDKVPTASHNMLVSKYRPSGNQRGWAITSAPNSGNLSLLWSTLGSNVATATLDAHANVFDGQWHHVAISRTGSATSYYRDGAFVASHTISGTGYATTARVIFSGQDGATISGFCQGTLDDVRIYDRALSPNDVSRIYQGLTPLHD